MITGKVIKVSGPLVVCNNLENARLYDTVLVSHHQLLGEIIEIYKDEVSIQVYEETGGIGIGDPVVSLERPLSVQLGPGLLSSMLDGIGRDLVEYYNRHGVYLTRGAQIDTLNPTTTWRFEPKIQPQQRVEGNDVLGSVQEFGFEHLILVPYELVGTVESIETGSFTVNEPIAVIKDDQGQHHEITMTSYWPIRRRRPIKRQLLPEALLTTGQRVIDTFFPIAKGGTAAVPGPFGSGKTVVQHQLAKWANSDIVVYIGCGERGNEMTDVLNEFPSLIDPKTNQPLMNKTVLIANTSNMPVAAREASIYTGMTIAEYFRNMGLDVALMADSTSRWAEALREMGARLEQMPGDEGYPAYLSSRLAQVYERAGVVMPLGNVNKEGSVTMIGAVSPAGGDLSEPVTQATLRVVKVFWALDSSLAYARHFPAIDWMESYSLYQNEMDHYLKRMVHKQFPRLRQRAMNLLKDEKRLLEIVQLIGKDSLSDEELLQLEVARMLREDFLQQNAFQDEDTYTSLKKQVYMLMAILTFYQEGRAALAHDRIYIQDIMNLDSIYQLSRMKYVPQDQLEQILELIETIKTEFININQGGES
ncbi:MAG TPA: V-type ATP synthase subunit A [Erysipelothrix sp.]|nr:V-type ATP synthase subunit A [Erysipelothrix sp.]